MSNSSLIETLYESIGVNPHSLRQDPNIAHIEIHHNKVLGVHLVPGLEVNARETKNGIDAKLLVKKDTVIEKPVQMCFGMIPETGLQEIILDIELEENARAGIFAHCTFPFARQIRHEMDAVIKVGPGAQYAYFERHIHGGEGGVVVVPKSRVEVCEGARYQTDFELIRGRVGEIQMDVEVTGMTKSVTEVTARVSAIKDDRISIRETAHLVGEYARGVLTTNIALQDTARAEIYNTLTAHAAYARGHVDCKEIVKGNAVAKAVPIVEVYHPKAHVTHEAAIGSVDSKQLDTLMSRGLNEEDATNLIIEGLLGVPLLSNG